MKSTEGSSELGKIIKTHKNERKSTGVKLFYLQKTLSYCKRYTIFSSLCHLIQLTLTEGEGSVQLTSSIR